MPQLSIIEIDLTIIYLKFHSDLLRANELRHKTQPWPLAASLGPVNSTWCCRKNFSQWQCSFLWKLRCHWLKGLWQHQIAVVRQGPALPLGSCSSPTKKRRFLFHLPEKIGKHYDSMDVNIRANKFWKIKLAKSNLSEYKRTQDLDRCIRSATLYKDSEHSFNQENHYIIR